MERLTPIAAGVFTAVVVFATNWLALIPWRKTKGLHWAERARVYHPVRVAGSSNLWVVPAVATLACILFWRNQAPHWIGWVLATALGAVLGTLPMDREVFPRIAWNDLLRQVALTWSMRFILWWVFLGAAAVMPETFGWPSLLLGGGVLILCLLWSHDGWLQVGRRLGLFQSTPERLQRIARNTAAAMGVSFRELLVMRVSLAQAFAVPGTRRLVFTERLLQLLSDDEVAAICAHEMAHLTERRIDYAKRYVSWLMFLPWVFVVPTVHTFGMPGFVALLLITLGAPFLHRRVSRRLEVRADHIAHENEPDPGTYARALLRLHEDNLLPAVNPEQRSSHPHLYDRVVAAGLTPDFPRPSPPDAMAWHGVLFSASLGALATVLVLRLSGGL